MPRWSALRTICGLILVLACAPGLRAQKYTAAGPSTQATLIREEIEVPIHGTNETWRIVWNSAPRSVCGPDGPFFYTCPCAGFSFAEGGDATLIRTKGKKEIERLPLAFDANGDTPPFDEGPETPHTVIQRWERQPGDRESDDLSTFVQNRPVTHVMYFGDYDHDGQRSEFLLPTGTSPCGRQVGVVIGVSKSNPKLHAFGTALHPNQPLIADRRAWDALLTNPGPVKVTTWPCGEHGAETETELELQIVPQGIKATRREYACGPNGRGNLTRTEEF